MKHTLLLLNLFFVLLSASIAQNPDKILVDKLYITTFDKVLDDISTDSKIKFAFDREQFSQINIDDRPMKKTLRLFLDQLCGENKLVWVQTPDSVIYFSNKYEELTSKPVEPKMVRSYTGPPKKSLFTLSGVIKDKLTGEALPFANISVKGTSIGTFANADGFFTLLKVPTDTSTLFVSYIGYENENIYLTPDLPASKFLIEMDAQMQNLKEVVISGEQVELMKTNDKISTLKMVPQKLSTLPNIGETDVLRSFQLMPGVSAANESSSNLYVRGGTPDQNLILYDGFTIYQVDHLYGFYSAFNPNAIKDAQLYKGGFESKFGGRLSSVLEITGKDGNSKGFNIGGDVSLLSFSLFAEVPIGKRFTSLIAYRRSYQGLLYDKIFKQVNNTTSTRVAFKGNGRMPGGGASVESTVTSYFYDLNAKFTYRPTPKDILSLSLYNGTDHLDNGTQMDSPAPPGGSGLSFSMDNKDISIYGNMGAGFKWMRNWNTKIYGNTLISFSEFYNKRERSSSGIRFENEGSSNNINAGLNEHNKLVDLSFKSDYSFTANNSHLLGAGLFLTNYQTSYDFGDNDTASVIKSNQQGFLGGFYLQDKIKLMKSKLTITPGIRTSYFSPTQKAYFEPRLSISYNLTEKIKFIGETGKFYQFANRVLREDILSGSRDFWILSDNNLVPVSSAIHYIAGVSYETTDFLASVEGYYKDINGVSEYSIRFRPTKNGTSSDANFYHGIGYSEGVEFLFQKKYGKLTGWISYSAGEAKNKIDVYGSNYFSASQDVTHEVKIVSLYELKNWSFSATWVYATGRPYTAPDGAYSIALLNGTEQTYINFGAKNLSRLPDYHRFDIGITYHLKNKETKQEWGNIGLSVFNVYNRRNIWYKEYQIISNEVIETDKLFLGITPNLTITLKLR